MAFNITKTEVERLCKTDGRFKTICPRCGKEIEGYPALSRYVDVEICSECGTAEALECLLLNGNSRVDFSDWKLGRD